MTAKTTWQLNDMIEEIDAKGDDLTPWEIEFIAKFIDHRPASFSSKQTEIIERIHRERIP